MTLCLPSPRVATKVALKASLWRPVKMAMFFLQPSEKERTELSGVRMNVPSFVKSYIHAQPMEMTISNAIWLVPFLLSAHWAPKNNKFPSALSLCSGRVLTPNSLPPRSRSLCWAIPSLQGVIEPIFTSLLPFHVLAKLQHDTILHMMIHSVKLFWD